jgi:hypothetical protein
MALGLGSSVKASLHEPGPSRFALTSAFIRRGTHQPPDGRNPPLAIAMAYLVQSPSRCLFGPIPLGANADAKRPRSAPARSGKLASSEL